MTIDPKSRYWVVTADEDEAQAAKKFAERFGYPPETITDYNNQIWLGPIKGAHNEQGNFVPRNAPPAAA